MEIAKSLVTAQAARRNRTHRIVRQLHLWIGAWGAIAAILFGTSGFVMNHRAVLKLPQGSSSDLSKVELPVPEGVRSTPEAMRIWLRDTQKLDIDIDNVRVMRAQPVELNGQKIKPPARWMFSGGNARVSTQAEYSAKAANTASTRKPATAPQTTASSVMSTFPITGTIGPSTSTVSPCWETSGLISATSTASGNPRRAARASSCPTFAASATPVAAPIDASTTIGLSKTTAGTQQAAQKAIATEGRAAWRAEPVRR